VLPYFAVCQAIWVNFTFSYDCRYKAWDMGYFLCILGVKDPMSAVFTLFTLRV